MPRRCRPPATTSSRTSPPSTGTPQSRASRSSYHILSHRPEAAHPPHRPARSGRRASHRLHHLRLALGQLLRARSLRPLRRPLRRPPPPHPHHDARQLEGPPAAQGLPRRGLPVKKATRMRANRTKNPPLPTDAHSRRRRRRRRRAPTTTAPTHPKTTPWSSTWARSILPPTASCAWCLRSTAKPSSRSRPTSATCTPASKRPARPSSTSRSSRSPTASTTSAR